MNLFYLTQDINFQKALLLVAILALILAILVSAYKLNSNVSNIAGQSWPPTVAPCPDYWDLSGNYCINSSGQNQGKLSYASVTSNKLYTKIPSQSGSIFVIPTSTMGVSRGKGFNKKKKLSKNSKKNWASLNGFVWDGLTSD
jgi:hypothetical protein